MEDKMAENQFSGVVEALMKGMDTVLSTKTVVGEATQIGDTIILPLVGVISFKSSFIRVLFPAPDSPTTKANSPSFILRLTSWRASTPFEYVTLTFLSSTKRFAPPISKVKFNKICQIKYLWEQNSSAPIN